MMLAPPARLNRNKEEIRQVSPRNRKGYCMEFYYRDTEYTVLIITRYYQVLVGAKLNQS